jgi:hypothetical protein
MNSLAGDHGSPQQDSCDHDVVRSMCRLAEAHVTAVGIEVERLVVCALGSVEHDAVVDAEHRWPSITGEGDTGFLDDACCVSYDLGPGCLPDCGVGDAPVVRVTNGFVRPRFRSLTWMFAYPILC